MIWYAGLAIFLTPLALAVLYFANRHFLIPMVVWCLTWPTVAWLKFIDVIFRTNLAPLWLDKVYVPVIVWSGWDEC